MLPTRDPSEPRVKGRVMRIVAGTYHVEVEGRSVLESSLRGRVKGKAGPQVSVGDLVRVERLEDGSCRIEELLPRHGALSRHGVARRREQVIVANVDQVVAVAAIASPSPDFSMIDRLLALAELNRIDGLLVINKADLARSAGASDPPVTPPPEFEPYRVAGYEVLVTSAKRGWGLEQLRAQLTDRITVFSGPSGVGKSSLLNSLMPGLDLRVGEVGRKKGRGRHTTVAAALYPFPGGGYVADTPGLQYLALWDVDTRALGHSFPEFRDPATECRFADCIHRAEPGCAVRDAVEAGVIAPGRYESYGALLREAEEGR